MSKKVKTIEPVKERRRFNNVDDFNKFFNDHQEEFEKTTTCKLNKKYEVPGYRITKINGEVSLKNIPESRQTALDKIEQHNNRLATIESTVNTLISRFNEVITKVNDCMNEVQAMRAAQAEQISKIEQLQQEMKKPPPPPEPKPEPKNQPTEEDRPSYRSTGKLNPIAAQWMGIA